MCVCVVLCFACVLDVLHSPSILCDSMLKTCETSLSKSLFCVLYAFDCACCDIREIERIIYVFCFFKDIFF